MFSDAEIESLNLDFFIWTPVIKGYATFNEMKTIYDVDDVAEMHKAIAFQNELDYRQQKEQQRQQK